jgi:hypothetical protein
VILGVATEKKIGNAAVSIAVPQQKQIAPREKLGCHCWVWINDSFRTAVLPPFQFAEQIVARQVVHH